jgi:hypothetical protein
MDGSPHPTLKHNPLAEWAFRHGKSARDLAAAVEVSHETARRWMLPFGDPVRRAPTANAAATCAPTWR